MLPLSMPGTSKEGPSALQSISSSCTTECKFHQDTHKRKTQCHPTSGEARAVSKVPSEIRFGPGNHWPQLIKAKNANRCHDAACTQKNKVHLHAVSCGFVLWVLLQVSYKIVFSFEVSLQRATMKLECLDSQWACLGGKLSFHSHSIIIVEIKKLCCV